MTTVTKPQEPLRPRLYHFGDKIREDGSVSALCFKVPKPVDLRRASWTIRAEAVTCPQCRKMLRKGKA